MILPDKLLSREAIKLYFCCWDYYDCVKILSRKIFYWFLISFFMFSNFKDYYTDLALLAVDVLL